LLDGEKWPVTHVAGWTEVACDPCCWMDRSGLWPMLLDGQKWPVTHVAGWREVACDPCCWMDRSGLWPVVLHSAN